MHQSSSALTLHVRCVPCFLFAFFFEINQIRTLCCDVLCLFSLDVLVLSFSRYGGRHEHERCRRIRLPPRPWNRLAHANCRHTRANTNHTRSRTKQNPYQEDHNLRMTGVLLQRKPCSRRRDARRFIRTVHMLHKYVSNWNTYAVVSMGRTQRRGRTVGNSDGTLRSVALRRRCAKHHKQ